MKTRPILFSTDMVKAILDGRKTQTRRQVKPSKKGSSVYFSPDNKVMMEYRDGFGGYEIKPKAMPGDIFWVRETIHVDPGSVQGSYAYTQGEDVKFPPHFNENGIKRCIVFKADYPKSNLKWKPSIFMPKEACRLFLKDTNVRVERLKDISEEDAIAEGIQPITAHNDPNRILGWHDYTVNPKDGFNTFFDPRESFFSLWESINGKESLDYNPWVWVYDFEITEKPENFITIE